MESIGILLESLVGRPCDNIVVKMEGFTKQVRQNKRRCLPFGDITFIHQLINSSTQDLIMLYLLLTLRTLDRKHTGIRSMSWSIMESEKQTSYFCQ